MKEWWQHLTNRERGFITTVGALVIILGLYYFVWNPVAKWANTAANDMLQNQALISWMQKVDTFLQQHKNGAITPSSVASATDRLVIVQQTLQQANFEKTVVKVTQDNNKHVTVIFKKVPFDTLQTWLISLWKNHGINVYSAEYHPLKSQGMVDATIVLGNDGK